MAAKCSATAAQACSAARARVSALPAAPVPMVQMIMVSSVVSACLVVVAGLVSDAGEVVNHHRAASGSQRRVAARLRSRVLADAATTRCRRLGPVHAFFGVGHHCSVRFSRSQLLIPPNTATGAGHRIWSIEDRALG